MEEDPRATLLLPPLPSITASWEGHGRSEVKVGINYFLVWEIIAILS
jgi:hypothetical protein